MTVRLAQITDPHVGAEWAPDALDTLRSVLDAVGALPDPVDGLLLTGDLAGTGDPDEYAALVPLLRELPIPVWVLPGNHDERGALRAAFGLPGADADPIGYAIDVAGLRVLMLDTTDPGEASGRFDGERLTWLAETLAADPGTPTLLALHHPPFLTGVPAIDVYALAAGDRAALAELLEAHPQVRGCVAGHVHRTVLAGFAGRPALTVASTNRGFPLAFTAESVVPTPAGLAFAVHTLVEGRLVSHVETLPLTAG